MGLRVGIGEGKVCCGNKLEWKGFESVGVGRGMGSVLWCYVGMKWE
jgi:hypothetical protein